MSRDALVVGINAYQHLSGLQSPARDAEAIAQKLQTYGDFRVHRMPEVIQAEQPQVGFKTPVTLRELETALVNLFKPKGSNIPHTALFYFSGHGIQKEAGIQEGYLALSDSNPEVGFYGLSLFWLRRLLQESPVRQRIIWLDCCHSGELLNFLEADPGARPGTDRLFMAASREYESAYESLKSPYSVFTQALLTGLDPQQADTGIVTNHSLISWVNTCLKGEIQQPLFESSGSEITLTRSIALPKSPKTVPTSDICPYRGLEFFDEAHAEYFFGREDLTDQLIEKLRSRQFVAVVGASGSGKSSLVRAGLISELRQGQKFSGSDRWRIKLLTPGEHPLSSLAAAFVDLSTTDLERAEQLRRAENFLREGGKGLAQLVRASLLTETNSPAGQSHHRPHLLLVIDQFEEVFTLCQGVHAEQERHQFFDCLLEALQVTDQCLSVLIVLRADFFGKCSLYEHLAHQIESNLVMVAPLSYEQIKSTIIRPAQKVGLACEPNLVYTMLLDVIGAPGELPLLQYTLLELWRRRRFDAEGGSAQLTLDTYTELGGVRGTLQKRATEIFYSLTSEEQVVAKRIFLALTQLGEGTEDTRRRVLKSDLVSPSLPLDLVERALEKLVAAKLVVTNQSEICVEVRGLGRSGQETIDVVHEALIRNWSLLRNWLDESREMLRRQRRIEQSAQEWNRAGQVMALEYLLRGSRLIDAEDFLHHYPHELSALVRLYITASQEENHRARRESRRLQIAIPSVLVVALLVTFSQYRSAIQTQAEKDQQLQTALSRERAAIAQSILQEPQGDPMAALLISRLAAAEGHTYEAESSLRTALQRLRLQLQLPGHQGAVQQIRFSPDRRHLATAGADGTIHLWDWDTQTIHTAALEPSQVLSWSSGTTPAEVTALTFSPDGQQVVAIAEDSPQIKVWSVGTGSLVFDLTAATAATAVAYSPRGDWIVTAHQDRSIALWQASTGQIQTRLTQPGDIRQIQISADGQVLLTQGADHAIRLWQLPGTAATSPPAHLITTLTHPGLVNSASFSPDGRRVATASEDGKVRIWDTTIGHLQQTLIPGASPTTSALESASPSSTPMTGVVFSPDGQSLAAVDAQQQVWLWNLKTGQLQLALSKPTVSPSTPTATVTPIAFSPNGQFLVTTRDDLIDAKTIYTAHLWNTQTGQEIGRFSGDEAIDSVQFSPDGTYVATGSAGGSVRLWSTLAGGELPTVQLPNTPVQWVGFVQPIAHQGQPESRAAIRAQWGVPSFSTPAIPATPATSQAQSQPSALTGMVAIAPDGKIQRWQILPEPTNALALDANSPNRFSRYTALVEPQQFWQRFWDWLRQRQSNPASPSDPLPIESTHPEFGNLEAESPSRSPHLSLTGVALSPDGRWMAVAQPQGTVEVRQVQPDESTQVLHHLQTTWGEGRGVSGTGDRPVTIRQVAFSPDSRLLLGVGDDLLVRLWNVESGQQVQVLRGHQSPIDRAQFSPNGNLVLTASDDFTARLWQVETGQTVQIFSHHAEVKGASFSPDGNRIVTASNDGTVRVSDVKTGAPQAILTEDQGMILDAQFSPDGQQIVTANLDGTARIWNAYTGFEQGQLRLPQDQPGAIVRAVFSPDGQYIATQTERGQVYLWVATWDRLLELAHDRSFRQLTPAECSQYLRLAPEDCPQL